jgi:hypothetical protein
VSGSASKSDFDRLGKRGSYRLGKLSGQGVGGPPAPRPFRPSFARARYRGTVLVRFLAAVAGTALIGGGAALGLWFIPLVVGLATGLVARWGGWRLRLTVPAVVTMAAAGWALALWVPALRGLPVGATARTIAAIAGLPASAAVGLAATLGVSVLLGLAGLWLGRALSPRPARN